MTLRFPALRRRREEGAEVFGAWAPVGLDDQELHLQPHAEFMPGDSAFRLRQNPFPQENIPVGAYKLGRNIEDSHIYRIGHPLAQNILKYTAGKTLPNAEITFNYSDHPVKISILEPLLGQAGYLSLLSLSVESLEVEDYLVFAGITEDNIILDEEQAKRLFSLPGGISDNQAVPLKFKDKIEYILKEKESGIINAVAARNSQYFDHEMEKLDKWADDMKSGLEFELKELDRDIKFLKTEAKKIFQLEEKLKAQREIKELEKKRNDKRRHLFEAQDEIDRKKEDLIGGIEARLKHRIDKALLFTIKWRLV